MPFIPGTLSNGQLIAAAATLRENLFTIRAATFNVYLGLTSGAKLTAINAHVSRVRPDVLAVQELMTGDNETVRDSFATLHGFKHVKVFEVADYEIGFLSKFPIRHFQIIESPPGATEFQREPVYCEIDVFGVRIGVMSLHFEPFCYNAPCGSKITPRTEYHRAVEWIRIRDFLDSRRTLFDRLELLLMGDWNDNPDKPQTAEITAAVDIGEGWTGFVVGSDIKFPILYAEYPRRQTTGAGLTLVEATDLDADPNTLWADTPNPAITVPHAIDFMAHTPGLSVETEILSSEATQTGGLRKYGAVLNSSDSRTASDHKLVFADVSFPRNDVERPTTHFDGTGMYVDILDFSVLRLSGENLQLEATFLADDVTDFRLINKRSAYNSNFAYSWFILAGVMYFEYSTDGTDVGVQTAELTTTTIQTGEIYRSKVIYDGTNVEFWINGRLAEAVPKTGSVFAGTAVLRIGAINLVPTAFAKGSIWDVVIGTKNNPIARYDNVTWQDLLGSSNGTLVY